MEGARAASQSSDARLPLTLAPANHSASLSLVSIQIYFPSTSATCRQPSDRHLRSAFLHPIFQHAGQSQSGKGPQTAPPGCDWSFVSAATWCVTDADINISGLSLRVPSFFPSNCVFGYSSNGYTLVSVPVSVCVCILWSDCKQLPLTAWPVSNCAASLLAIVLLLATVIGFTQALPYRCHHYRCRLWVICPLPPLQTAVLWLVYREIN